MANVSALCSSFKGEILSGIHALGTTVVRGATTADTLMGALYLVSASLGAATTVYSTTGEVSGSNYTAGGVALTNANPPTTSGTAGIWTPSGSLSWVTVTLATPFDTVLIYNATQGNRAIAVLNFGSTTVSAANFSLTMPADAPGTALVQIS